MKFMTAILAAAVLFVVPGMAKADLAHPLGITSTYDTVHTGVSYDLASLDLGTHFKVTSLKGITVNAGAQLSQATTGNWENYMLGPQVNVEWNRLFTGVYYNPNSRRLLWSVGLKINVF